MTAKDYFGLVIRIFGLFGLYYGVYALTSTLYALLNPKPHTTFPGWGLCSGVVYLVISVYLVRGAPQLLWFAYPETHLPAGLVPPLPDQTRNPWDTGS